jgi:pilus assembly protein CpaB
MNIKISWNKRYGVLLAAIIFGVTGASGAYYFLNQRIDEIREQAGATVSLVVAKEDLATGAILTTETLSARDVPAEWMQSGAVRAEEFSGIEQSRLKVALAKGEMVMWSMVERPEERVISAVVAKGRRAVTVPVDEISSLSGMLQPGDLIDLIVTTDNTDHPVNFPVLQQVRVIATGTRMQVAHGSSEAGANTEADFTTITLDATPEEARRIIAARDGGRLTAMLRNPDDHQAIREYRLSLEDLSEPEAAHSRPRHARAVTVAATPAVRIIYGDQP